MFTELEKKVIEVYKDNEIVSLSGWQDTRACTWASDIQIESGLPEERFNAVVQTLEIRGMIWRNGKALGLTWKGIQALKEESICAFCCEAQRLPDSKLCDLCNEYLN